jgi:hypothetical protein
VKESPISIVEMSRVYDACAQILGERPSALTPEAVEAVSQAVDWKEVPGWESMSDAEIAMRSGLSGVAFSGQLLVVTEASFAPARGAFEVDAGDLVVLIDEHLLRFGECFFNGDVIVVDRHAGQIWLFHHEGVYASVFATSIPDQGAERDDGV